MGRRLSFWPETELRKKKNCETGYRENRGGQAQPIRVGAGCCIHKETQPAARRDAEGGPRVGGSHFSSNPNWDRRRCCAFGYRALFFSLTFSGRKSIGLPPSTIQSGTNKKCQPLARSPLPGTCGGPLAQPQCPAWGRGRPGASLEVPIAAVKSWALSAAGRSVGRGMAVTAGKGTERGPRARCASLSCGICTRDSAQTPAAWGTAEGGKGKGSGGICFLLEWRGSVCVRLFSPAISEPRILQIRPESVQIDWQKDKWRQLQNPSKWMGNEPSSRLSYRAFSSSPPLVLLPFISVSQPSSCSADFVQVFASVELDPDQSWDLEQRWFFLCVRSLIRIY